MPVTKRAWRERGIPFILIHRGPMTLISTQDRFYIVKILAVSAAVTAAAIFLPDRYDNDINSKRAALAARESFAAVTAADIRRLDEVLTMSARLSAATGDAKWERRYTAHIPDLDAAIKIALAGGAIR